MTTAAAAITTPRHLRAIVREFVAHVVEGEEEINQQDVIAYATKKFSHDQEFLEAAARDVLSTIVPQVLRDVMHERKSSVVQTAAGYVTKKKIEKTARERLAEVFEGTGTGYRSMLAMRKAHLLALNVRDNAQIETMSRWVGFRAALAQTMTDTQVVGDLSSTVIESAWKKHLDPQ